MRHKSGNVFLKIFMHALVCGEDIIGVACKLETLCLYNVLPVIHAALRIVSLIGLRRPAQTQTCSQWISKKSRACGFNALRSVPVLTKMAHSNIAVPTLQYSCPLIVWCLRCCFELLASVFSTVSIHVWWLMVYGSTLWPSLPSEHMLTPQLCPLWHPIQVLGRQCVCVHGSSAASKNDSRICLM